MKRFLTAFVALLLVVSIPFTALAMQSPLPGTDAKVEAKPSDPNAGDVFVDDLGGGRFHLQAKSAQGHEFQGWDFDPEDGVIFEEGTAEDDDIIVRVEKDTTFTAKFSDSSNQPGSDDPQSPASGDYSVLFVMAAIATLAGAAYVCKKVRA